MSPSCAPMEKWSDVLRSRRRVLAGASGGSRAAFHRQAPRQLNSVDLEVALRRRRVAIQAGLVDSRREAESTAYFHAAAHPSSPLRACARQLRTLAPLNLDLVSGNGAYLRHAHLRPDLFREEDYERLEVDLLKPVAKVLPMEKELAECSSSVGTQRGARSYIAATHAASGAASVEVSSGKDSLAPVAQLDRASAF